MKTQIALVAFMAVCSLVSGKCHRPSLLVVSFDGFRHDYFLKNATPHMMDLRSKGTYAEHMKNVFPTKTFPNHHSIATGVFPEVHGVLLNEVYDPTLGRKLEFNEMWNTSKEILPIWTLNEMEGEDCHSGTVMWPGGNVPYQNVSATFNVRYDRNQSWEERVDIALSWFTDDKTPANLVMVYFEQPDYLSHRYGPESEQVLEQIKRVDETVKYIVDQMNSMKLTDVNVILLSDHGMSSVNKSTVVEVGRTLKNSSFNIVGTSPVYHIWPETADADKSDITAIYNKLKDEAKASRRFNVYRRDEIPERWHYRDNFRIPPILVVANEGSGFQDLLQWNIPGFSVDNATWGVHGYDNADPKMWPFFFAFGPQFLSDHKSLPFHTVDLYLLFAEVLRLKPRHETNGTMEVVGAFVVPPEEPMSQTAVIFICLFVGLIIVIGLLIAYLMRRADLKRPRRNEAADSDPTGAKPEDNPLLDPATGEQRPEIV